MFRQQLRLLTIIPLSQFLPQCINPKYNALMGHYIRWDYLARMRTGSSPAGPLYQLSGYPAE